jgi:methyl-accepting chemotaxis protein
MVQTRISGSYVTKFAVASALAFLALAAVSVELYTTLEPQLSGEQQSELFSGLLALFLVFFVAVGFIATTVGREGFTSLTLLRSKAQQVERGNLDVDLETTKRDELGDLYRAVAAMRDGLRARIQQTRQQNEALQRRATEYSAVMEEVGNGDLSQRLDEDADIEAMARLARDFNQMMDQLERTVGEVYAFTEQVDDATTALEDETARSMEATMEASTEIYRAAQGMQDGAAAGERDGLPRPEELEGADAELIQVDETVDAIEGLNEQMNQIEDLVGFITEVADETNMLALNAGIEASKVEGDGAEGFQVVAEEVKELAEETRDGASEMETISSDIRTETNEAVYRILEQQAALLSIMDTQTDELSDAAKDLRGTLTQLDVRRTESTSQPSAAD